MNIKWEDKTLLEKICLVLGCILFMAALFAIVIEIGIINRFPILFWFLLSCANCLQGIVNRRSQPVLSIVTIVIHGLAAVLFGIGLFLQIL